MRSVRTGSFHALFCDLPSRIQDLARDLFAVFKEDPDHAMLNNHPLSDSKKGRHRKGSRAVSITFRYRAIYVPDEEGSGGHEPANVWYWIGSHESYNRFIGSRRH